MSEDNRIPIAVGVTGHRAIRGEDEAAIFAAVRAELEKLRAKCPSSPLVLLTSLAEGADLLCADAAEALGIPLWAALPTAREEYEKDFSDAAKARLAHHCARAERVFVTPYTEAVPADGPNRDFRFRQAGIYVASHCHVLLALWDGGEGTAAACGTAEAVDFALRGSYLPANGAVSCTGRAAVIHIFTPRGARTGCEAGTVRALGDEDALRDGLAKTDEFNHLVLRETANPSSALPAHEPNDALLERMDHVRAYAGRISRFNAGRYRSVLAALALSGSLFAAFFLLYDTAGLSGMILGCGCLLAVTAGILRYAARAACHRRYLEYRALAECLRVALYLRYAGSAVQVSDLLTWTQREETAWIARALAVLEAGPPAAEKHDIREYWVDVQRKYHAAAGKRSARERTLSDCVIRTALIGSIILYCAVLAFELLCGGAICRPLLPVAEAETYRMVLKLALGLLSVVTVLIAGYYGNLSLPRALSDHRKLEHFYEKTSEMLAQFGQMDALLVQIAREELIENGNWCSYQQDNTPDISL